MRKLAAAFLLIPSLSAWPQQPEAKDQAQKPGAQILRAYNAKDVDVFACGVKKEQICTKRFYRSRAL
jgi:hypothetical protein